MTEPTLFDTERPSQEERILSQLRRNRVVCGDWFLDQRMPRYPARIFDLKAKGHVIEPVSCPYPYHTHIKALASYELRTP